LDSINCRAILESAFEPNVEKSGCESGLRALSPLTDYPPKVQTEKSATRKRSHVPGGVIPVVNMEGRELSACGEFTAFSF